MPADFGVRGQATIAKVLTPDICVIGGGAGGPSVAIPAAAFKVLVARRKRLDGGDCLNTGCVPSKALLAAGNASRWFGGRSPFGLTPASPIVGFRARARAPRGGDAGAERFGGRPRRPGHSIRMRSRSAMTFRSAPDRVVIATGSTPALQPIASLEAV